MENENRFSSTEKDLELREEIRIRRAKDAADLAEAKRLNAETARINADSWKQIAEANRLNADTDRILRRATITVSIAGIFIAIALIIAIVRAVH